MFIPVPYADYKRTAKVLTDVDLARAALSCADAIGVLHQTLAHWSHYKNDPFVRMWSDSGAQLCEFGLTLVEEMATRRGGPDGQTTRLKGHLEKHLDAEASDEFNMDKPVWWGDYAVHLSHQRFLILLDPVYYHSKWPGIEGSEKLFWPST